MKAYDSAARRMSLETSSTNANVELGSAVCCGYCYCSKKAKCLACLALWIPVALLVCLGIALLVNGALVQERYERTGLFPGHGSPQLLQFGDDELTEMAERLAGAVAIQTVSYSPTNISRQEMEDMHEYIEATYPELHSADYVAFHTVNGLSRLYRIQGLESTANPYLMSAHLDVVPPGDLAKWDHDPFNAGVIDSDGGRRFVYGRGSVDHKLAAFGILEALNRMVRRDKRPRRTLYVALGHDEEVGGKQGASHIADVLNETLYANGETLDFILEEGVGVITDGIKGVEKPLGMIGVAEKGYLSLELEVKFGEQGHSSRPPKETAIGILAAAVAKLEQSPHPSRFGKRD